MDNIKNVLKWFWNENNLKKLVLILLAILLFGFNLIFIFGIRVEKYNDNPFLNIDNDNSTYKNLLIKPFSF